MGIHLITDYRRVGVGFEVVIPHPKVTMVTINLLFFTLLIVLGAKFDKGEK